MRTGSGSGIPAACGTVRRRPRLRPSGMLAAASVLCVACAAALSVAFLCIPRPSQGLSRRGRQLARSVTASDIIADAISDLVAPVDIRTCPWETLRQAYQKEARRCWGEGFDGKVPGYIAEALPAGHPAKDEEPPFRRRWLGPRKEEEKDTEEDPYQVLGVSRNATSAEIKKAYLQMAKLTHPDRGGDPLMFQDVLLSYRILSSENRRKSYDETGKDTGDHKQDEVLVKVPDAEILRDAIDNHPSREMYWDRGFADLVGKDGKVQCDDPGSGLTEVLFDISATEQVIAWLPTHVLIYKNSDGEEQPYDYYQKAIMRLNRGQMIRAEPYQKQLTRSVEYSIGWASVDGTFKADPLRDAAFAQGFFKQDREAEDRGVLLDLGCGDGSAGRLFARGQKFDVVFGLDVNSTALHTARVQGEDEEIGPEQGLFLLRADAQDLPFQDQQIDYVWWSFGWDDVTDPESVLKGIFRVLKVGGRLAIATSSGRPVAKEIQRLMGEIGFEETTIYPPRARVFLNYAFKPR